MIAGDPLKRHDSNDTAQAAISYFCLDENGLTETKTFPTKWCRYGLRAQVYFPQCWDGRLDSHDHRSHVAYPISAGDHDPSQVYYGGRCPDSHPYKLSPIFMELQYDTEQFNQDWKNGRSPFVLSTGDDVGYSFHADFVNGWVPGVLQHVIDHCHNGYDTPFSNCGLEMVTPDDKRDCKLPSIVPEDVAGPMLDLPGCNPINGGPGDAPMQLYENCPPVRKPDLAQELPNFAELTSKRWKYTGCARDNPDDRSIRSETHIFVGDAPDYVMTNDACVEHCDSLGATVAATQSGMQCFCGWTQKTPPIPKIMGDCGIPCSGNASQICGGRDRNSVYRKCVPDEPCDNYQIRMPILEP
jgi:hypothetical protein